jgi:sugar phosphate isomerase/epimerase
VLKLEFVGHAWHYSIAEFFESIPGFTARKPRVVEVGIGSSSFLEQTDARELDRLLRMIKSSGLKVNSIHAPFGPDVDISSFNDDIHEKGVASLIEAIELTQLLGARFTVVHAGNGAVTSDRSKRLDRAAGVIRELAVIAEESDVILAVENLPPGYLCNDAEELLKLVDATRSNVVGVCFDTGHANLSTDFREKAARLLPRTVTIHIHDNDGTADQHKFPGQGSVDWFSFAELFHVSCPRAPMLVESGIPDGWDWYNVCDKLERMLTPSRVQSSES